MRNKAMSEPDNEADPQTKITLINPLAYTHLWPPFGNCDGCGKAGAPYVGFDCGPGVYFCDLPKARDFELKITDGE
jgi:hypothetical protein